MKKIIIIVLISLAILTGGYYTYRYFSHRALVAQMQREGWVLSQTWDCPSDHPIKANLNSGIYHTKRSQYYKQTNARNSHCFDTVEHAKDAGFRAPKK